MIGRVLLDRYTVQSVLGRGGMSVVFLGRDSRLDREVAIKVFSGLSVKEEAKTLSREHFVREAFALSELRHPNTLRIYDFGYIADDPPGPHVPFQVSEYMDGGTLHDLVRRRGSLSEQNALAILHAIGGALSEAHSHGIVHRDVKPSNILFAQAGKQRIVKLSDFSVAFALTPQKKKTTKKAKTRTAFYSLGWSAPEQVQHKDVTPTADVYGLGLLLAFMLSGEAPRPQKEHTDFFREPQVLDQKMSEALNAITLPSHLREVCLIACRAKPEDRFRSVDTFLEAVIRARAKHRGTKEQSPWSEVSSIPPTPSMASVESIATIAVQLNEDQALPGGARVRMTRLPADDTRVHLRTLNCFVRTPGSRLSTAIDLCADTAFELVSKDQTTLASLRTAFADDALYLVYGK